MDDVLRSRVNSALSAGKTTEPFSVVISLPQNGAHNVDEVTEFIGKRGGEVEFVAKLTRSISGTMSAQCVLELSQAFKDATVSLNQPGELEN